jgi:hypothetical protein
VPVLVRTSYFPNWAADGAEGPFRVSPNFMVVVPTETEVTLSYEQVTAAVGPHVRRLAGVAYLGVLDAPGAASRTTADDVADAGGRQ